MNFKSFHIVCPRLLGRTPSGKTPQRADVIDFKYLVFYIKSRNISHEILVHTEIRHIVLTDIKHYMTIIQYYQTHNGSPRSYQFSTLGVDG